MSFKFILKASFFGHKIFLIKKIITSYSRSKEYAAEGRGE